MQQPGADIGAETVAVFQACSIKLAFAAVGAVAPGFLAGIAAGPLAPAQLLAPLVHQPAAQGPAREGFFGQGWATGGAGE